MNNDFCISRKTYFNIYNLLMFLFLLLRLWAFKIWRKNWFSWKALIRFRPIILQKLLVWNNIRNFNKCQTWWEWWKTPNNYSVSNGYFHYLIEVTEAEKWLLETAIRVNFFFHTLQLRIFKQCNKPVKKKLNYPKFHL